MLLLKNKKLNFRYALLTKVLVLLIDEHDDSTVHVLSWKFVDMQKIPLEAWGPDNVFLVINVFYRGRYGPLVNIRIYHKCEGRIEKSILSIDVWHHDACRVMTNDDPERQIFLSYPHTNNRLFNCSPLFFFFF